MTANIISEEAKLWAEACAAFTASGGDPDYEGTPESETLLTIERRLIATPMPCPEGVALKLAMFARTMQTDAACRAEDFANLLAGHIEGAAAYSLALDLAAMSAARVAEVVGVGSVVHDSSKAP